ncbi:MAG TPA: hypothetical protein VEX68_03670, partial [Bryobacteraceae bacterium]|nr:hypothetical protein [Bryobacteraceae bacterium]
FYRREANRYPLLAADADRQQAKQFAARQPNATTWLTIWESPAVLAPINRRHIAWPLLRGGLR